MPKQADREVSIIDIRRETTERSLREEILSGLGAPNGMEKKLPTMLLYDEAGLRLFEKITYLEEYYLTNAEIEVLTMYAEQIAQRIPEGSMVVELGSGNLRKVKILLQALDQMGKKIEYYALDLDLKELKRTFAEVQTVNSAEYKSVKLSGLHGTYNDGLEWLQQAANLRKPKTLLWLGSSVGNFTRPEAGEFLKMCRGALGTRDQLIVGVDGCKEPNRVFHAYNDREGVTHAFVLNGLRQANRLLGTDAFKRDDWKVFGEYDAEAGRHQAFVYPTQDVIIEGVCIKQGERCRIEHSYKYSDDESERLWEDAGFVEATRWSNGAANYALHMLSKPMFSFSLKPEEYAKHPVPSVEEWRNGWAAWDVVTQGMISKDELLSKPIKLRNACIFYVGHIPAFLDIQLTRVAGITPTEPAYYHKIFERGIDPDVDNPDKCHAHSEIPDTWPPLEELLEYQTRVRQRVLDLYESGAPFDNRKIGRALWLGLEHEAMHLETLLYMLIQSEKTLPPPSTVKPDFEAMARAAEAKALPNDWKDIPATTLSLGMDDPETTSGPERFFGWDAEKPSRAVPVHGFFAKSRPITNGEYARYLYHSEISTIPAGWAESIDESGVETNGVSHVNGGHMNGEKMTNGDSQLGSFVRNKFVKTVYGPVALSRALDWPAVASYDELAGCAAWMGGRIPTVEEVESIYKYAEQAKVLDAHNAIEKTIPAVNAHLVNDGVEETPPSKNFPKDISTAAARSDPHSLFLNLEGCNVGFKHWHPMPISGHGAKLCGRAEMGGVWEWTSSALEKHGGYEPMELYPGFSADFFDGKHNIVLGGSWATHPRLAGRKSFVNWYQRNYPYVWAGARVVRDK
ncbi:hypothetical protein EV356DRAFT_438136 [Viridothelium virens]|uniref:DUF323 domain protein n=1 Tax=Viridothelium virens TaxID=1048519 RepID=A0A6A6HRS4_VIRVR|nr:hypothetical protein EV356DRAFT_438136 [Viridothelium virens]